MAFDREKARAQLLLRTQESYDRREGGVSFRYFKADTGIVLWNPKPTTTDPHILDIVPYEAGDNYPFIGGRKVINKGDLVYKIDLEIHQNIGPAKMWIVCPAKNYGLGCPICEEVDARLGAGEEWNSVKDIVTKRRCAFNVLVYDGKNDNKIQVWEVSHKYSDKQILLQAKSPRTGGVEPFSDPDVGKSISFEVANDEYKTIQGHKLLNRDYIIPDDVLNRCFILDSEIIVMEYDQIANIYKPSAPATQPRRSEQRTTEDRQESTTQETRRLRTQENTTQETPKNNCPHNHTFGEDIDRKGECGKCKAYDGCAEEADKINERIKAARKQKQAEVAANTTTAQEGTVAGQRRLRRPTVTMEE